MSPGTQGGAEGGRTQEAHEPSQCHLSSRECHRSENAVGHLCRCLASPNAENGGNPPPCFRANHCLLPTRRRGSRNGASYLPPGAHQTRRAPQRSPSLRVCQCQGRTECETFSTH